jgi:hypothetical protein
MTCTNHSYPESNWVHGTEFDDLPLSQAVVDRVLEKMVSKWHDGDKEETVFEFNNHIMMNAPLLYDRVTYSLASLVKTDTLTFAALS